MSVNYVGLFVQIHGIKDKTAEEVQELVKLVLRNGFTTEFSEDIEVTIEEFA